MCGIAGQAALRADRAADLDEVRRMVGALVHRGPDGEGLFLDPGRRAALGMRRLAVIDLVTGDQPIFSEDGTVACVLNGEIYNFAALRADLERRGHRFRTQGDTEAIVHLYEEEGDGCVARLRGMFAFAVWDARRGRLLVARDRLGKKPLYYAEAGGRLAFASELPALAGLPGLPRDVDPVALDLYLAHGYVPSPHAIFQAVRKLPPASLLTVEDGRVEVRRYWRPDPGLAAGGTRGEIAAAVRAKLEEAVALRLVSDVPLGAFLSGGVDSSTVVALMARASDKPVRTFSIGFTVDRFDERPYAREIARLYGTEHHEHVVTPDAVAVLPDVVRRLGEPFGDASAIPTWYVARLARQEVTVALNGDGGDELFAGYDWYRTALRLDRASRALPRGAAGLAGGLGRRVGGRAGRLAERLALGPGARFASLRQTRLPGLRAALYSPGLLARVGDAADRYLPEAYAATTGDPLARLQATDLLTYLPEDLLVKADRMTMAHSLEGRSPLLDHELVELCLALPAALKLDGARTKVILREATRDLFPPGFLDRPKQGFSVPVARWLREELRERADRTIGGPALAATGWFRPAALRRLLDEHAAGKADWSPELWNLLVLGEWAALFLGPR